MIGAKENILPAAPGNLQRRPCLPAAAFFGRPDFLHGQGFLRRRRARGNAIGLRPRSLILTVEGVDHRCGDQHGCGKPGNEVLEPGISGTRSHAFATEPLRDEWVTNDLPTPSVSFAPVDAGPTPLSPPAILV